MRLIIVGGLKGQLIAAARIAVAHGASVTHTESLEQTLAVLRAKGADLLMIDVVQPIAAYVAALEAERIRTPIVACGTSTDARAAVAAIQAGAREYVPLPPDPELIAAVLEAVAADQTSLIWRDPAMERVVQLASQIARSDAPVLVTGESGTGKEVIARHLHQKSLRKDKPFVAVNCAAIPDNLLESELFGHEKGAFTGALNRSSGRFEQAEGGTLFLDEIADLALDAQPKLLRALDGYEVRGVGAAGSGRRTDVRVVTATHIALYERVVEGGFRKDLYHRLEVFVLDVPPLRERRGDVLPIAKALLEHMGTEYGPRDLTQSAASELLAHHWHGNVRELHATLMRAAVHAKARGCRMIDAGAVRRALRRSALVPERTITPERARELVDAHGGNASAAARAARLPRTTFRKLLDRIEPPTEK